MKILLVALNAKYSHTGLAVRYLRDALAGAGYPAVVAEYTVNQPLRSILAELTQKAGGDNAPRFLFSCYLWNIDYVRRLGADLRLLFPACRILLGGPEVSFGARELLSGSLSFADAILCGEGERLLPLVIPLDRPRGVYHAEGDTRLDSLPFPYRDELSALQNRVLYYEASRGCPFGCSYCLSAADRRVRVRALPLVLDDLRRFLDARVMQVKFVDRTFNADPARAEAIWAFLIERDNGFTSFQMEVGGDLLTASQLALLARARPGLLQLEIGVQSTCEQALLASCRTADWLRLAAAVRTLRAAGRLHLHLDLIAGLPHEGFGRFLQSFDEVFALAPHQLQLGFLKLLRGAPLFDRREEYRLVTSPYPPYEVLQTPALSFAALTRLKLLEEMVEVYYNSGRFSALLEYLLAAADSPARFFLALADSLPAEKPGKYEYYDRLFAFGETLGRDGERMRWLLRYDLCLHERPRRMPAHCAPDLTRAYRPALEALGLEKTLHTEVFPFDPAAPTPTGAVAIAFDYGSRDLFGHAATQVFSL